MDRNIRRTNVDAHFVLSLGAKVNKNKCRVSIVYKELRRGRDYRWKQILRVLICPHWRTDASTKFLVMLLPVEVGEEDGEVVDHSAGGQEHKYLLLEGGHENIVQYCTLIGRKNETDQVV